jgi:hypothetical protein
LQGTGEDLDQRRFAGAVVADEGGHLPRPGREIGAAQSHDAPEALCDAARFD